MRKRVRQNARSDDATSKNTKKYVRVLFVERVEKNTFENVYEYNSCVLCELITSPENYRTFYDSVASFISDDDRHATTRIRGYDFFVMGKKQLSRRYTKISLV